MTKITVEESLLKNLLKLAQPVELCDPSGNVVGRLFPVYDLAEYEPWEPAFSEEELQVAENSTEWYTTEQVLKHLESL